MEQDSAGDRAVAVDGHGRIKVGRHDRNVAVRRQAERHYIDGVAFLAKAVAYEALDAARRVKLDSDGLCGA